MKNLINLINDNMTTIETLQIKSGHNPLDNNYANEINNKAGSDYADPAGKTIEEINNDIKKTNERLGINIPFVEADSNGHPKNPYQSGTGVKGRGDLGKWGPNLATDFLAFRRKADGTIEVGIIKRKRDQQPAMPGGFVNLEDLNIKHGAVREWVEESLNSNPQKTELVDSVLSDIGQNGTFTDVQFNGDSRNTDNAWMLTSVVCYVFPKEIGEKIELEGGDDASFASWEKLSPELLEKLEFANHGTLIAKQLGVFSDLIIKQAEEDFKSSGDKEAFKKTLNQLEELQNYICHNEENTREVYGKKQPHNFGEIFNNVVSPNKIDIGNMNEKINSPKGALKIDGAKAILHDRKTDNKINNKPPSIGRNM